MTLIKDPKKWSHKPDDCIKCGESTNWHMCPRCFFSIGESDNDWFRGQWMAILNFLEGKMPHEEDERDL